jgi:hypothetical protein
MASGAPRIMGPVSEIPYDELSYRHVVAEYFLGLRGAGLMLSPLDAEQVAEWEQRGIPVAVVCRGLRRGFDEHVASRPAGATRPRSLRALRGAVEAEWRGYRSGRVGDAPAPPSEQVAAAARVAAARAFLAGAARGAPERIAAAYGVCAGVLEDRLATAGSTTLDAVESALARADGALVAAWLAALTPPERAALGRRVALRAGHRRASVRRRSHRESLRAHLLDAAREAGLLCLRGSV